MKYAAYLERYNFSFSDTGVSQLSLGFSNPALQLAAGSYVELNPPGISNGMPCSLNLEDRSVSFSQPQESVGLK